jgi:hypothetical protein
VAVGRNTVIEDACDDQVPCRFQQRDLDSGATNPIFVEVLGTGFAGSPFLPPATLSPDERYLATFWSETTFGPGAQLVVDLRQGSSIIATQQEGDSVPFPVSAWTADSRWILQQDGERGIVATSMPTPGMRTERIDLPGLVTFTVVAKT